MDTTAPEPTSTILIIDDSTFNLQLVGWILQDNNYKTLEAISGAKALEVLKNNSPDLILLDVMMPEMTGFELCKIIKSDKKHQHIPVIFFTTLSKTDDIVKGFEVGGVDYVTKPFNKEELVIRIKTHLDLLNSKRKIERQAKELAETNALKDKMFSVIGHDLRSPVGSIKLALDFISKGFINPNDEDFMETVQLLVKTTDEAYNLLENLLGWAKSQSGTLKVIPDNLNLSETINSTISLLKLNFDNKKIKIEIDIPQEFSVYADIQMFNSVFRNLISNAIKFTPENGNIKIWATSNENFIKIYIKDTGVGIPAEKVADVFKPNNQIQTYGTNNEVGSGLGLILCSDFVLKNGGQIEVESEVGIGSTFSFTLPISA